MNKLMKVSMSLLVLVIIFCFGIFIYVGNYIYDYTLNRFSHKSLFDYVEKDNIRHNEAQKWLDENTESLYIEARDEIKLHGYFLKQESSVYMIMVHGYKGDGASIIDPIRHMEKKGYNLLVPDLRGHGKSEGDYIGMGTDDRLDIIDWIEMIIKQDHRAQIILYGVSMGGATVMNVSGEKIPSHVKAIIEDCGYTSIEEIYNEHIKSEDIVSRILLHVTNFVTQIRAGYNFSTIKPISQIQKNHTPILFIHGGQDEFVPISMVYQLYQKASGPKSLLIIEGAGHASSNSVNAKVYYQQIYEFIDTYTKNI